jgi:hypothetical protein
VYIIEIATTIEQNQIKQSKICLNVFTCKIELYNLPSIGCHITYVDAIDEVWKVSSICILI